MGIYYIIIALVALASLSLRRGGGASGCLDPLQTVCINGVFILMVFVSHLGHLLLQPMGYEMTHFLDMIYLKVKVIHGQLIVVPFLFYSGYGVATQMMNKPGYLAGFLRNRALPLWMNFLVALACYLVVTVVFVGQVRIVDVVKSFVFLHSFGNPTWFLFCTMVAYFVVWLTFKFVQKRFWVSVGGIVGMLLYIGIVSRYRPIWWYDTALMFPLGVVIALYKDEVLSLLSKRYWVCAVAALIGFVVIFNLPLARFGLCGACFKQNALGVLLMLMIMLFTMRIKVESKPLEWLGRHVFPIYMYHMFFFLLAKVILGKCVVVSEHLLVLSVLLLTLTTAILYKFWRISPSRIKVLS